MELEETLGLEARWDRVNPARNPAKSTSKDM